MAIRPPSETYSPLGAPASNLTGPNFTPPFPAYPSGHAGFGGALFEMLRNFYRTDRIPFTFASDEFNGVTRDNAGNVRPRVERSFSSLSQAEEENGQSRIYLGIHWSFDKTEGIARGRLRIQEHLASVPWTVNLVYFVGLVCLVDLVCFVYLVDLVPLVSFVQPKNQTNQTDRIDQINKTDWRTFSASCSILGETDEIKVVVVRSTDAPTLFFRSLQVDDPHLVTVRISKPRPIFYLTRTGGD